ncbi:MAG: acyl-CoA desaturase [Candidatus Obscuribacterales bacterium]|nr:acyl-CoA desaturase [Candidatus Obscuribacterales bacterium]
MPASPVKAVGNSLVLLARCFRFLDSDYFPEGAQKVMRGAKEVEIDRCIPFVFLHAACLGVLWTGTSAVAVGTAVALYWLRMFAITAFYHRYFSHRTYKTSRFMQFAFAVMGATAVQRGPLWWAAHHRCHHREADKEGDIHSPVTRSFVWSHIGWITSSSNMPTNYAVIPDLARYPELVLVNRFDWLPPVLLGVSLFAAGSWLQATMPELNTSGWQMVVWGFFISTVVLFHGTACINSLAHKFGSRRFNTDDDSKNNWLLAIFTLGEGWHNNHHKFPGATSQGIFWWELDVTYLILKAMSKVGLVWNLHHTPPSAFISESTDSKPVTVSQ